MNEFFNSVKSDLTDRRLMPIVVIVGLALLAALAYAAFGAGSSTPTASVEPAPVSAGTGRLLVTPAQTSPTEALAETTSGVVVQRHGQARDPFNLLPGSIQTTVTTTTTTTTTGGGESSTSSSGGGSSSGSGGESKSSTPSSGSKPTKHKAVYKASVLFGELPAGVTPADAELTSYPSLTKPTPLPNAKEKRIELVGVTVTKNGKGALFALDGEVILHGPGVCLPSSTQCEVVKLQEGKSEQLEFLPTDGTGPTVTYELRVVSVEPVSTTAKAARRIASAQARVARKLFAAPTGALRYSSLRYAADSGAFVPGHSPFAAH
jgi:hypothetical protein